LRVRIPDNVLNVQDEREDRAPDLSDATACIAFGTQPERITKIYGISACIAIEIDPACQPDGVFLGEDPLRTRSYRLRRLNRRGFFL
jgi:hypothetical protein